MKITLTRIVITGLFALATLFSILNQYAMNKNCFGNVPILLLLAAASMTFAEILNWIEGEDTK